MNIKSRHGRMIVATSALVLGLVGFGTSAAFATDTPSSGPSDSPSDAPPSASISCTAITEGYNSVTVTGIATFDAAISNLDVKLEVDTESGGYTGTQHLEVSGPFSITVSDIPATTQAQVITSGSYVFNEESLLASATANCSTDASVVIANPPASGGGTTTPPASGGTTAPPATTHKVGHPAGAGTDGLEIAQRLAQQQNNEAVGETISVIAIVGILGLVSFLVVRRVRKSGASA